MSELPDISDPEDGIVEARRLRALRVESRLCQLWISDLNVISVGFLIMFAVVCMIGWNGGVAMAVGCWLFSEGIKITCRVRMRVIRKKMQRLVEFRL